MEDDEEREEAFPPDMLLLNEANFNKTISSLGGKTLVVLMHYPWCVKWAKRPNAINVQSEYYQYAARHRDDPRGARFSGFGYLDLRPNPNPNPNPGLALDISI